MEEQAAYSWPKMEPWKGEPDKIEWQDVDTGYFCRITRGYFKHLIACVCIPPEHPLSMLHHNEIKLDDSPIHGGICFSGMNYDKCQWEFGFHCDHEGDYSLRTNIGIYRNINYVIDNIERLADLLKANDKPRHPQHTPTKIDG